MAGSIKWMIYELDSGNTIMRRVDESNGEALGFEDFAGAAPTATAIEAASLRSMRYILCVNQAVPTQKRRFWVGTPDFPQYVNGGTVVIDGITWEVSGSVGEKKTFPTGADTGLDDGDAT